MKFMGIENVHKYTLCKKRKKEKKICQNCMQWNMKLGGDSNVFADVNNECLNAHEMPLMCASTLDAFGLA